MGSLTQPGYEDKYAGPLGGFGTEWSLGNGEQDT